MQGTGRKKKTSMQEKKEQFERRFDDVSKTKQSKAKTNEKKREKRQKETKIKVSASGHSSH